MKIAVVDQKVNKGGLSRVIKKLLPEISKSDKISITYFGNREGINRENLLKTFDKDNIKINFLQSLNFSGNNLNNKIIFKLVKYLQNKYLKKINFLPYWLNGNLQNELNYKLKDFDLIYFPWPFLIEFPKINKPIVATFHDFNFKYYFSGNSTYSYNDTERLNRQMNTWIENSEIIVSNNFTKLELIKFYPNNTDRVNVIPLSYYSKKENSDKNRFNKISKKYNLPANYVYCGTNNCAHKNLNPLFAALNILKSENIFLNLVLTGNGTEIINGISCEYGVELKNNEKDVMGLGYIDDEELDEIIKNADILISPEMYTSDNGPATDGWINGIPTILANIPSNIEHIETQSVHAELFDYRNPLDIALKIKKVINNKEKYKKLADKSKIEISKIDWTSVSEKYISVFKEAYNQNN
jgi:hypothetical protein|tara:strand:- start:731 stop:1966 length:1236 start_codon:yes stop_codon:yes gene_type:complete